MNLLDPYYECIIYQKNAVENLAGIIKKHFFCKKVFFLSSKTAYKKFGTLIVNQLNRAGSEFVFKFVEKTDTKQDWDELVTEANNCGVLVALGAGSVADCAKYVSHMASLPFVLVPTLPTTTAYFSDYCFVQEGFLCHKVATHHAFKILIDENIITKAESNFVQSGLAFVQSFWEVVLNLEVHNLLFEKKQNTDEIKLVLAKCKDNHPAVLSGTPEGKLLLMDTLIDLGKVMSEIDLSFQTCLWLANLLCSTKAINGGNFGTVMQTAAQILLTSYNKFFSLKKIDVYSFLDVEALAKHLGALQISTSVVKLKTIKSIRQNQQLFLKINAVKHQISYLIGKYAQEILQTQQKQKAKVDIEKCFMSFHILPYVYDCCCMTNLLCSSGIIS